MVLLLCLGPGLARPSGASAPEELSASPWTETPDLGWRPELTDRPYWRANPFRRILDDQIFLVTDWWPSEFRRPRFMLPVVLTLAAASRMDPGAAWIDPSERRSTAGATGSGRRAIAEGLTELGNGGSALVLLGGSYLVSRWTGNRSLERATSLSTEALLNAAIYSGVFKRLSRRTRPSRGGTGQFFVTKTEQGQEANSFPSGHATGAFAVAAVFASEYREQRWVRWVAYGTAGLIAWSRVELDRHFPSDIAAGALLGRSIGKMVVWRAGGEREPGWSFRFSPLFDPATRSLGLAYRRSW